MGRQWLGVRLKTSNAARRSAGKHSIDYEDDLRIGTPPQIHQRRPLVGEFNHWQRERARADEPDNPDSRRIVAAILIADSDDQYRLRQNGFGFSEIFNHSNQ